MNRLVAFTYGTVCYLIFFATFLYAAAFVGNVPLGQTIDGVPQIPFWQALLVNTLLLGIFALQHSGMARPGFKRWWTRIVPEPVERSTYVLTASLALLLLFHTWQPMGGIIWDVQNPTGQGMLYALLVVGWLLVLYATFLINHFDLFGLRQVWLYLQGKEYLPIGFRTPGIYRHVRHPLYLGFLLGFWATPRMTAAHFLFAIVTTVYMLVAIRLEERDLVRALGQTYADYRRRVPMLIPGLARKNADIVRPVSPTAS